MQKGSPKKQKSSFLMSVVEEESNQDDSDKAKITYSQQNFEDILAKWWSEADNHRGNVSQSAELIALTLVKDGVFKEVETSRRNIILAVHQQKTKAPLTTYPSVGEDMINLEEYNLIFAVGIFRELLTQLAMRLKEVMHLALKKDLHFNMNQHLNNYQRQLILEQLDVDRPLPLTFDKDGRRMEAFERPILGSLAQYE